MQTTTIHLEKIVQKQRSYLGITQTDNKINPTLQTPPYILKIDCLFREKCFVHVDG